MQPEAEGCGPSEFFTQALKAALPSTPRALARPFRPVAFLYAGFPGRCPGLRHRAPSALVHGPHVRNRRCPLPMNLELKVPTSPRLRGRSLEQRSIAYFRPWPLGSWSQTTAWRRPGPLHPRRAEREPVWSRVQGPNALANCRRRSPETLTSPLPSSALDLPMCLRSGP